jgi:phosphoglycolate phosphatase-like HAD superfamily hydrolase
VRTSPSTRIEVLVPDFPCGRIRFALFDFDGTLSLIREGWQTIMISFMVEELSKAPLSRDSAETARVVRRFVTDLTGKQTIYQMIRLAEEVASRGGHPLTPLEYKREYHSRLWERIKGRVEALRAGLVEPDELMVPGSRNILEAMRCRGVSCLLVSGTDQDFVLEEAKLLGISRYFEAIYGAIDDYKRFSKRMVIDRILTEHQLSGPALVTLGDGYVEIENTRNVGGIAVGVASREAERSGIDEWKRSRLVAAGAHIIIPDFQEHEALISLLFSDRR